MTESSDFLWAVLIFLLIFSGFFSGSETAMMAINRYRLRHMAKNGHQGAQKASRLLEEPEKLISLILIGNNFVNILASAIATLLAVRLMGEQGIVVSTILLTVVVLIFSEVTPKTLAAHYPERVAIPAAHILQFLLKILGPLVWCINTTSKYILILFSIKKPKNHNDELSRDELSTLLTETGGKISKHYQQMMLGVLDLETATVEDVMVPSKEVIGIDLEDDWETILKNLMHSQHTRLPVYRESLDRVVGMLHVRHLLVELSDKELTKESLLQQITEAYYIPESTSLFTQLQKFQENKCRMGLVVDEYGEVLGLATLDDILEEIVGEFTTDNNTVSRNVKTLEDGNLVVPGNISIRELNRLTGWDLPTDGPKTLNGLIIETLETIPASQTGVKISTHCMEILHVRNNTIRSVKLYLATEPTP